MKLKLLSFLVFPLSVLIFALSTLSFNSTDRPAKLIKTQYVQDLDAFEAQILKLKQAVDAIRNDEKSIRLAQEAHLNTRLAYKRIEFLIAHMDPEGVKDFLNGPPLLSFERNSSQMSILEPEGLQVLDEILFGGEVYEAKDELITLTQSLTEGYSKVAIFAKKEIFTERQVLEGIRFQLVRIMSLGLTGFDTPGSLNGVPEAQVSFEAMLDAFMTFVPYVDKKDKALSDRIVITFSEGINYLEANNDFNTFDRLYFIKNYITPLYEDVLAAHLGLYIETIDEISPMKQPIDYKVGNPFDPDFFNPFAFTKVTKELYKPEMIELGRTLFFDPALSGNNQQSCASCHNPDKGFTDQLTKSLANTVEGGTVERNAPTLLNSIYAKRYFLDLRSQDLGTQADHVVNNPQEFHTTYNAIIDKLRNSEGYLEMFEAAFGKTDESSLSKYGINIALTAYQMSLQSMNSKFDRYVRGESDDYTEEEILGFNLFMGKAACGTCHFAPTFSGLVPPEFKETESEVLGVPSTNDTIDIEIDPDMGRYTNGRLKEKADHYKFSFKTTTVRNIAITPPYMHNGVYNTLEEVVDFYNRGGGAGMGLDLPNQTLGSDPLDLTDTEQKAIVAFMETLTDTTGLTAKPIALPKFENQPELNDRPIGGAY